MRTNQTKTSDRQSGTSNREMHIGSLFTAELQFRLASAVRLAVTGNRQPLNLPMEWTHGQHRVRYEEIALRQEQADYAAIFLHRSATYLMAVAMKDAIQAVVANAYDSPDLNVQNAFQIARLVRNAFAHAPFSPVWLIDNKCRDKTFAIADTIELNTTGLDGKPFDWRHYGGPLALFRLCRFVRTEILKDQTPARSRAATAPERIIYQQGDLILEKIDGIPSDAVPIEPNAPPDAVPADEGHVLDSAKDKEKWRDRI